MPEEKRNPGALQSGLTQQEVLGSKKVGGSNPFTDITITTSPLFKNPPDILADDLHGERALTTRINSDLERTVATPSVVEERERIKADRDRLMSGYFRNGERLGEFSPEPRIPEKEQP